MIRIARLVTAGSTACAGGVLCCVLCCCGGKSEGQESEHPELGRTFQSGQRLRADLLAADYFSDPGCQIPVAYSDCEDLGGKFAVNEFLCSRQERVQTAPRLGRRFAGWGAARSFPTCMPLIRTLDTEPNGSV
jgi:hypothetical protein